MKRALITGINGQDGSYLSEYLLSLGYEVHGMVRRHSVAENQNHRLVKYGTSGKVFTHYGDLKRLVLFIIVKECTQYTTTRILPRGLSIITITRINGINIYDPHNINK